ncbi:type II toxin-antitoxin system VapC family toxin [bacterium]|nr:type II toxin-antitoxin system VapC family toxin [bacterium]
MITFVDSSVLLDVFLPDPKFGPDSANSLDQSYNEGSLIINEIIYAELSPQFPSKQLLDNSLRTLGIRIVSFDLETAYLAGTLWKEYRDSGGKRNRIMPDFLIGTHAQKVSDRLLTRDCGFYRKYFNDLEIIY